MKIVLTLSEHSELLTVAEIVDPPRPPSRVVGHPAAVARFRARIPETYSRLGGEPIPVGWTGMNYTRDLSGEVEIQEDVGKRIAQHSSCPPALRDRLLPLLVEKEST